VIAAERARRPHSNAEARSTVARAAEHESSCPFCVGNEASTPAEVYRDDNRDGRWLVRVVPNKFAALSPDIPTQRVDAFFRRATGVGHHEVIIETPNHSEDLADMSVEQVTRVMYAYRERQRVVSQDSRVRFVIIFRNKGPRAGTSLAHPHSQLVATPVVPLFMRDKHQTAERYFDDHGRCLYCDVREAEEAGGTRLIEHTEWFTVFAPFASRQPFETWIMPRAVRPSFGLVTDEELGQLARVLRRTLRRLRAVCGDVDYNYVVHSCPRKDEDEDYYLWHIQILPRLADPAGFELGTRMFINTVSPEVAAQQLREVSSAELE
jgi:UDPglucose--hexose-1-phosphate uridylyltransferase